MVPDREGEILSGDFPGAGPAGNLQLCGESQVLCIRSGVKLQIFRINDAGAMVGEEAHSNLLHGHKLRKLSADFQILKGATPPAVQIIQGAPQGFQKISDTVSVEYGSGVKTGAACERESRNGKTVFR